jgi:dTDP-4-dehydrorhamnose reductase
MKVLVTGVAGQLGHDVMNELSRRGYNGVGSDLADRYNGINDGSSVATMPYISLDITDSNQVSSVIEDLHPDVVVHCAAWTAVDAAEEAENRAKVEAVNVTGTENIAKACADVGAKMVYLSTDYVFDGQGTEPWQPDQKDFKPLNVYGQTKLAGEEAVRKYLTKYFIVRIAWVFGINGHNFIKTMLKVGKTHDEVRVVNDQIGTPTYTYDLARLLVDMIETDRYGTYHATNSEVSQDNGLGTKTGYISWYDFTREIYRQAGYTTKVTPVTTEEYGLSKAKRPFNSRLDKSKLVANGFKPLPDWTDALSRYLKILKDYQE